MSKNLAEIVRKLTAAARTPNILMSQRHETLTQLQAESLNIGCSLLSLTRLYRLASLHPKWAESILPFLEKHTHLKCWELAYWRFRSNLCYNIQNNKAAEDFVALINEHAYCDNDVVLLAELLPSAEQLLKYQGILENIMLVIAEQMHLLTLDGFIKVLGGLIQAAPHYPSEVSTAVEDYTHQNVSRFEYADCGPLLHLSDLEGLKPKDALLTVDPKIWHHRRLRGLLLVNQILVSNGLAAQTYLHNSLPKVALAETRFIVTRKESHDSRNIYNLLEDDWQPEPSKAPLAARSMRELCILSKCMMYVRHEAGRVDVIREANRIARDDPDVAKLIEIMYFSEKYAIHIDLQDNSNLRDVFSNYLEGFTGALAAGVDFHKLLCTALRMCVYTPELAKHLRRLDLPLLLPASSSGATASRLELLKALTIHKSYCRELPEVSSWLLAALRKSNSKLTTDIMYMEKLELYTGRRQALKFVTSKRQHRSAMSQLETNIVELLKEEYPYLGYKCKYVKFGYEVDLVLQLGEKEVCLDINGPSHFYLNAPEKLNLSTISKNNLLSEICDYEHIDLNKSKMMQDMKYQVRKLVGQKFGPLLAGEQGQKIAEELRRQARLKRPLSRPDRR